MDDVLILIHEADIPAAIVRSRSLEADGYSTWVFDSRLVDIALANQFRNVRLVEPAGLPEYQQIAREARNCAIEDEARLNQAVQHKHPEVSLRHWQYLNYYYLHVSRIWYSSLWKLLVSQRPAAHLHIFLCDRPAQYYEASFYPALLLIQQLERQGATFSAFSYSLPMVDPYVIVDLESGRAEPAHQFDLLVHVPTCFYDAAYINQEIQAIHRSAIGIHAYQWNVGIQAEHQVGVRRGIESNELESLPGLQELFGTLLAALTHMLATHINSSHYCSIQAHHLARLYLCQQVSLQRLMHFFADRPPKQMLMSDHDAGLHGPLSAFAQRHDIPVTVIPHAKTSSYLPWAPTETVSVVHAIQGAPVTDATTAPVESHTLSFPDNFCASNAFPRPLRTIGILLNATTLNGVPFASAGRFFAGIRQLFAWCSSHGIGCDIRCKPNNSIFALLVQATGCDAETLRARCAISMQEYVASVDLCVMFDTPSSAAVDFLNRQVPLLAASVRPWSDDEATFVNPEIIPILSVTQTIEQLSEFQADARALFKFRQRQTLQYLDAALRSRPLRDFLDRR